MARLLLPCFIWAIALGASLPGRSQTWQWATAQSGGTAGPVQFTAMAFDGAGNTLVGGSFQGTVALGSFMLSSAGGTDGVVARLSPAGVWLQAERVGSTGDDAVTALAVSATGTVWVAGGFNGSLTLGGVVLTGGNTSTGIYSGMFLASLTPAGQWQNVAQATSLVAVAHILPEQNGDALLVGYYYDAYTSFGTVLLPKPAIRNTFVARYRPGTGWLHVTYAAIGSYMGLNGAELDAAGNLVLAGYLSVGAGTTVTFGSQTAVIPPAGGSNNSSNGYYPLYVARFGRGGTWTQLVCTSPGTCDSKQVAMALDATGNVLLAASLVDFRGTFGTLTLQNPVPTGNVPFPYLARLSAAGTWTQVQGGVGPGGGGVAALRPDGSYLTFVSSNTSFGVATTTATGTTTTQHLPVSSAFGLTPTRFAVLPTGRLVVAGTFYYPSASFGNLPVTTNDQQAAFVASADGVLLATNRAASLSAPVLFPNPARTAVTLRLPLLTTEPLLVSLLDATGRFVSQQTLPARATEAMLDLAGLPPGLYLVRAGLTTERLIVE